MIKNLKKAFTIIELVIVIAVIAILAAVMIPTYSSLVKKANLSADEQAVKQMNTALAIYTAENGKPGSAGEVKIGLSENDINADTMEPVTQGYAFYWNPSENKIVLVGPGKETAKDDWVLLTTTGYGNLEEVSNVTGITNAINSSSTTNPALIKLSENIEILSQDPVSPSYPTGVDTPKTVYCVSKNQSVILDLNGNTLTDLFNSYYVFAVEQGGILKIKNGIIESKYPNIINTFGGTVSLDHVEIKIDEESSYQNTCALKVDGFSDVSIVHCTIINPYGRVLTSNSGDDINDGARISISNSKLISKDALNTAVYIPTYVNLAIDNCEISGAAQGIYLRGCNAIIKNSSIYNTGDDGTFLYSTNRQTWLGGNFGYAADIVFAAGGDGYIKKGNYICENVTGKNGDSSGFIVIVHEPQENNAKVQCSGITVNQKFVHSNLRTENNQPVETWAPTK